MRPAERSTAPAAASRALGLGLAALLLACSGEELDPVQSSGAEDLVSAFADDPRYEILENRHHAAAHEDEEAAWAALPFERLLVFQLDTSLMGGGLWSLDCGNEYFYVEFERGGAARWEGDLRGPRPRNWTGRVELEDFALLCATAEALEPRSLAPDYAAAWFHDMGVTYEFEDDDGTVRVTDYGRQSPAALQAYRALVRLTAERVEWTAVESDEE